MKTYSESLRQIPAAGEYDVIIVGDGISGVALAIATAREGTKTLILEETGSFGVIFTVGLMSTPGNGFF